MKFDPPLMSGRLIQRYKRFLADIELDSGQKITATCPNTGSMLGLTAPQSKVWVSTSQNPSRKYAHTWEMIEVGEMIEAREGSSKVLVGINTSHPNGLVAEAIKSGVIAELSGYQTLRREVKYGLNSRIDILLEGGASGQSCYVEVKNVHLLRTPGLAEFPDCKTERGVKHLHELAGMIAAGHRAIMVYLVQRGDANRFSLAKDLDPAYAAAFKAARSAGVEMICYRCRLTPSELTVDKNIEILNDH